MGKSKVICGFPTLQGAGIVQGPLTPESFKDHLYFSNSTTMCLPLTFSHIISSCVLLHNIEHQTIHYMKLSSICFISSIQFSISGIDYLFCFIFTNGRTSVFLPLKSFSSLDDREWAFPLNCENDFTFCVSENDLGASHPCDVNCWVPGTPCPTISSSLYYMKFYPSLSQHSFGF